MSDRQGTVVDSDAVADEFDEPSGDQGSPPAICARDIEKRFGSKRAVAGTSLEVPRGELVALLGPSGSGKTTLLRVIAGFERPDAGTVEIGGRLVAGGGAWVEPERRRVGMVFQDDALFPHLTVAGNVAFGTDRRERVDESLALVGLADRARSYPHELSGGERQRVALARALAPDPEVVLLDEPFASLDAGLRETLRGEVAEILARANASALLVTHDQEEALSLAGTVAVMRAGRVEQVGSPEHVYGQPATRWVAEFLGEADVLPATAGERFVECELGRFGVSAGFTGAAEVVVRPESVAIGAVADREPQIKATVVQRTYYGHDQLVVLELPTGRRLRSRRLGFPAWHPGDRVHVWIDGPVNVMRPGPDPDPPADGRAAT